MQQFTSGIALRVQRHLLDCFRKLRFDPSILFFLDTYLILISIINRDRSPSTRHPSDAVRSFVTETTGRCPLDVMRLLICPLRLQLAVAAVGCVISAAVDTAYLDKFTASLRQSPFKYGLYPDTRVRPQHICTSATDRNTSSDP